MATRVPDFYAKHGETFSVRATLAGVDDAPQDLSLATAVAIGLRPRGGGTSVFDQLPCTFTADDTGSVSFDSPEVIDKALAPAGLYEMDFTASFPGGITHKFPNGGPNRGDEFLLVKISEAA
jgi:hypothetical protein